MYIYIYICIIYILTNRLHKPFGFVSSRGPQFLVLWARKILINHELFTLPGRIGISLLKSRCLMVQIWLLNSFVCRFNPHVCGFPHFCRVILSWMICLIVLELPLCWSIIIHIPLLTDAYIVGNFREWSRITSNNDPSNPHSPTKHQ